jgi:hypothetical protein
MPQVFPEFPPEEWRKEASKLKEILKPDEWELARASTLNSHYTSPEIIRAIYAGVERLGFNGGRILEPACGVGHFIGLMPEAIHTQSTITGIEIDSITARISKLLYPDADIRHSPFEKALLPDGSYDLAISNVPFGDYQPYDKRFNAHKFPIHDYFFAATMDRVRPGGLIAFITSKGTLDKQSSRLRRHLSKQADLVTAIRLPNTAFARTITIRPGLAGKRGLRQFPGRGDVPERILCGSSPTNVGHDDVGGQDVWPAGGHSSERRTRFDQSSPGSDGASAGEDLSGTSKPSSAFDGNDRNSGPKRHQTQCLCADRRRPGHTGCNP